jgi:hypothetical protein
VECKNKQEILFCKIFPAYPEIFLFRMFQACCKTLGCDLTGEKVDKV